MFVYTPPARLPRHRGFTMIELLVTIALVAILAALAVPSLRSFIVRNTFSSIGNEFSGSILRTRNEAVTKNICTTICLSNTINDTAPYCAQSGQNWQIGWIAFINPKCDTNYGTDAGTNIIAATDMLLVRGPKTTDYLLNSVSNTTRIEINARGNTSLSAIGEFDVIYLTKSNPLTVSYGFNICLDQLGRTRSIPTSSTCSNF